MLFSALGNSINTLIRNIAHESSRDSKLTILLCVSVGKHKCLFWRLYSITITITFIKHVIKFRVI